MYDSAVEMQGGFYGPLTNIWVERIKAARQSKTRFNLVAKTCNDFYESQRGFMWNDKQYFNGELPSPKFAICIAKAFEFVSIIGPHLFWNYADRKVFSQKEMELVPELFGDPQDPEAQQLAQQVMLDEAKKKAISDFANDMMGVYLNWSQREQPGTLMVHGNHAVTESLIKGMACLWPETYSPPGSDAVYTRLCHDTIDNLFIDPDCKDPLWETAGYIMCRHSNPLWQVERMFGLPRGELEGKGTQHSAEMQARKQTSQADRASNKTFDLIEWYEIWSKVGVGPRTKQLNHHMIDMFDDKVGDYAYLCIAPGVEYPLNAPPDKFFGQNPATSDQVAEMFQWRCRNFGDHFPAWKDNRWPVSTLSYHPLMGSPWPMAPLGPGLGELIAINVLTSSYIDSSWSNRQQILAYLKSAASEAEQVLNSDDAVVKVGLNDNIHEDIGKVIQFLQKPMAQGDQLQAIEMLSLNFNRRVGLNEMQYGESKTQIRIASDSRAKTEALSIRPQKMSGDVGRWLTNASQLEMFLAAMHVQGKDLTHLLGEFAAEQWDNIYSNLPIERLMREAKATVEASEVRRPNKERDTANIQSLQQFLMPLLQQFARETGNTDPLNEFGKLLGEAMDMPESPINLPEWKPQADPEQQQAAKADQEAELRKKAADAAAKEAAAKKQTVEAAATAMEMQIPGAFIGEMQHEQELRHKEEGHEQDLIHEEQTQIQRLLFDDAENSLDLKAKKDASSVSSNGKS